MNNLESALAGIEQMLTGVTKGPWIISPAINNGLRSKLIHNGKNSVVQTTRPDDTNDAVFIAASRALIPALVKALRAAVEQRNAYAEIARVRKVVIEEDDAKLTAILANGREGL